MKHSSQCLTLSLIVTAGFAGACKKVVTYDRTEIPKATDTPVAQPQADANPVNTDTKPATPDTKLKLSLKRINADSWWKVCLDAWVIEFPQSRQKIGCNTDSLSNQKNIDIDASTKQCNTIALSLSVYRNTETCTGSAQNCKHEENPSHIRSTTNPADRDYFRAAYLKDLSFPFTSKALEAVVLPPSFKKEYEQLSAQANANADTTTFRVFFEDQISSTYNAWKQGADAKTNGIDYFDYVIELGSQSAPLSLEGSDVIKCKTGSTP